MKRVLFLISICLFYFSTCDLDVLKHKYVDWDALMNAPENEKAWFPPLFKDNLSLKNNISNIIIFNDLDTNNVWGEFVYLNNTYNDLSSRINPYIKNGERGFTENKIKLYFTEIDEKRIWYYYIDTNEKIIYFYNYLQVNS